jgi:pimeloyl-ACP methyl ester carboxylesterase
MAISNVLGQEREATVSKGTIRYRETGRGEPLLFIQGLGVNGDLWRKVVPTLSKDFHCITADWPLGAHSVPMAPDADLSLPGLAKLVVDFMDAIELESATLVGNDTGGAMAQLVGVDYPERATRLVLNSCELYERFLPPQFKPLQMLSAIPGSLFVTGQLLRFRFGQAIAGYGLSVKHGLPERAIMQSYVRAGIESAGIRRDLRKFLRAVDSRYTLDAAERMKSFEKPVLVVWGAEDRLFPLDYPRRFAAAQPNARLEIIPDARTFVPEDQPKALAEAIARFVREPAAVAS